MVHSLTHIATNNALRCGWGPPQGILDPEIELKRLEKKKGDLQKKTDILSKKMSTGSYADKTPDNVKESDKASLDKLEAEMAAVMSAMEGFRAMQARG
eukprot:scaffold328880_cov33-Prasinocladus_malaysianus.AAC.2